MPRSDLVTASRAKLLLARLLTSSAASCVITRFTGNQIRHYGLRFDVSGADFSPRVRAQLFWRTYEGAEIRMIRRHLQRANMVVELGSSLGITSAHIISLLASGGRILCVEANPYLIDGLRKRTATFSRDAVVEVLNVALSTDIGTGTLSLGAETIDSHLVDGRPDKRTVTVPTTTLRHLLKSHSVDEFDLVSDIEGAEASFLIGDPHALDGCRRAVLELHDSTHGGQRFSPFDLINAAEAQGFRVIERHGPVVALVRK